MSVYTPKFEGLETMRSQLNLPPDAQARQQMLAQLHSVSKVIAVKPIRATPQETKQVS